MENILQTKSCTNCQTSFHITDKDQIFYDKMSPIIAGKKFPLPTPDICPDCRSQLRVMHRNEANLYHNASAISGKPIISLYASTKFSETDVPYKVYTHEEWWSDSWDGLNYGRDFDFNRPFFEQFYELDKEVPCINLMVVNNENSPYTTGTGYCKNCHLINSSENCEDCYYGKLLQTCKNVVDSSYIYDSELIYECFNIKKCYNCIYLSNSENCIDCFFSADLHGCKNCFLSTNLSQKEYYFLNEKCTKEEYNKKIQEFLESYTHIQKAKNMLSELEKKRIHKYVNILNSENCTGDFIFNSKNCMDCYDMNDSQDCKYVQVGINVKDLMDCSNMYLKPELNYEVLGTLETYNVIFSIYIFHSRDIMYSDIIHHSKNLFGCSGLRNKQYCILNKQYTKEQYEELVPKIIEHMKKTGEWGKFFPASLSPYAYNETLANDYFPLTKERALSKGYRWREKDENSEYQGPLYEVPDNIKDVNDDILKAILTCEITGKLYKILPQELTFYRNMNLPVPRRCPDERHKDRMKQRNKRHLWKRNCNKCNIEIDTTYAPDRPETIYCEKCYLASIY